MPYLDALRLSRRRLRLHDLHRQQRPARRSPSASRRDNDLVVAAVLSGNRNFEGAHPPPGARLLPGLAAAGGRVCAGGHGRYRPHQRSRSAPIATVNRFTSETSGRRQPRSRRDAAGGRSRTSSTRNYAEVFDGDEHWRGLPLPTQGDLFEWDSESTYVQEPPYFERPDAEPMPPTDIEDARVLVDARRLDHDRPHLAGGLDSQGHARRSLSAGARRRAARLQLVWRAARQPPGDDARHLRQRSAAQRADRR